MNKTINLYENDDFESWTDDSSEPLIFIHILDRGLDLSFNQYQWFEFMRNIKNTNNKVKCVHCFHETKKYNICCICDKKGGLEK